MFPVTATLPIVQNVQGHKEIHFPNTFASVFVLLGGTHFFSALSGRRYQRRMNVSSSGLRQGGYTQFAIQDLALFGPNPWQILRHYLSTKGCGQPNPWNRSWTANVWYENWM